MACALVGCTAMRYPCQPVRDFCACSMVVRCAVSLNFAQISPQNRLFHPEWLIAHLLAKRPKKVRIPLVSIIWIEKGKFDLVSNVKYPEPSINFGP